MEQSKYVRNIDLLGTSGGLVKQLSGFRKKVHFVPEAASQAAESFVQKIAADDVAEEANELFDAIKANFGYKRREIQLGVHNATAEIIGKDFDLIVRYGQDADDVDCYEIEYLITNVSDPAALRDAGLQEILRSHFDRLRFNIEGRIDLEALIDRIEDDEPPNLRLHYPADCSFVELHPAGREWHMRVSASAVAIISPSLQAPGALLTQLDDSQGFVRDVELLRLMGG